MRHLRTALVSAAIWLASIAAAFAQTQGAVIYNIATGRVVMAVIPTYDWELDDPAFNQPGTAQVRVQRSMINFIIPRDTLQAIADIDRKKRTEP